MLITKREKFINYKKLLMAALNIDAKTFVVHVLGLEAKLLAEFYGKIAILVKYKNYINLFFFKFAVKVPRA